MALRSKTSRISPLYCGSCAGVPSHEWERKQTDLCVKPDCSAMGTFPFINQSQYWEIVGVIAQSDQKEVARSQPNDYCPEIDLGYLFKTKVMVQQYRYFLWWAL